MHPLLVVLNTMDARETRPILQFRKYSNTKVERTVLSSDMSSVETFLETIIERENCTWVSPVTFEPSSE